MVREKQRWWGWGGGGREFALWSRQTKFKGFLVSFLPLDAR